MNPLFTKIVSMAGELVDLSTKLDSNPDPQRAGGVVTWALDNISDINWARVGDIQVPSKWGAYERFSQEKIHRAYADFLRSSGTIISSWQTRDEAAKKYGGAILFNQHGTGPLKESLSFSGLKEPVDEAVSLVIGTELRQVSDNFAQHVIEISDNQVYHELREAYRASK
jgi:hypothetical protein